ncbi:hypothetical protein BH10ACT7_BH10ACT7_26530 [soil metagenome]
MATVDKDSANWRLFGGGGLLVGGLLWLIAVIVGIAAPGNVVATWISIIGVLLVGVALFLVAFGETGSNGAVGASLFGKLVLVAFGLGWVVFGLVWLLAAVGVAAPSVVGLIAGVLVVVGGILSTFAIWQRHVARGAARWIIAVPVILGILFVISALGWVVITGWWLPALVSLGFLVTGLLYLLNRKDIG